MQDLKEAHDLDLVDPDPFTVISAVLGAAAVLLQLPQTAIALRDLQKQLNPSQGANTDRFRDALAEFERHLDRVTRAIDRGSRSPESEFYDVKFRIGAAGMQLDYANHREFSDGLNSLFNAVGGVSIWANHIIREDAALASLLGEDMLVDLSDAAQRLNELVARGATNREILAEARMVVLAARRALPN